MFITERIHSLDGSIKYVWDLNGKGRVESVLFSLPERPIRSKIGAIKENLEERKGNFVLCVSSQVGCNIKCSFCATGLQPSKHNLSSDEISRQVELIREEISLSRRSKTNLALTFAGMGEPLLNFENVTRSSTDLLQRGLVSSVSLSTVGIVPGIRRLAVEKPEIILFVSLHATTDESRRHLIPLNDKYSIADVLNASRFHAESTGHPVIVSYLLFSGINDSDEDLDRLCQLLDPQLFNVQILMWNEIQQLPFSRVSDSRAQEFADQLRKHGFHSYVTASKARDIGGGCGQLVTSKKRVADLI